MADPDFALNRHVLLLLAAAILWSLGGVLIKSIDLTPVAIAGARSLIAAVVMSLAMPGVLRKISWQTIPGAIAYSATVFLFVVATKLTTAANAIFLQYTAPIYIAMISPWFLGERTNWQDWLLVLLALSGVGSFLSRPTQSSRSFRCHRSARQRFRFRVANGADAASESRIARSGGALGQRRHFPDCVAVDVSHSKNRGERSATPALGMSCS